MQEPQGATVRGEASRRVITSIDEFVDYPSVTTTLRTSPLVLRQGAMRAEIVTVGLPGVVLTTGDYSMPVATHGETLADRVFLAVPLHPIPAASMNGDRVAQGVGHAYGGAAEVTAKVGTPAEFATMAFNPEVVNRAARALRVEIDLPGRGEYRPVPTANLARRLRPVFKVRQSIRDTGTPVSCSEEAAEIADKLVEFAVRCYDADNAHALSSYGHLNSTRIITACEDYAVASQYQNVTLGELCAAANVSERRVRHAFYDCYGMSPTAYMRIAALHAVRRLLIQEPRARDAVSRAASDFGFWHLSRFASQYRALFGELPSATCAHQSEGMVS